MIQLLKNLKKQEWALAALSVAFVVFQVWLELTMPDYMSRITVLVKTPGSQMADILAAGGKMLLCALGSLCASALTAVCAARIATGFSGTLRSRLFSAVQSFSMEEIGRFSTASLITRSTNDVTQVQMVIVLGLQVMVKAPVMAAWAIAKIAGKQWQWTLSTAAAVAVLLLVVGVCLLLVTPRFKQMQRLTDDVNRVTRENLTGLSVVRAYNAEEYQEEKFARANEALTATQLFNQRTLALMMPSIQLVMSGLSLAVYWIGAILIQRAGMGSKLTLFSDMMVFSQYAMQVVMAFMLLVMIFTGAPFHLTLLEALYPLITLFFFSLGVGLFLAAATVFFRDIMHIWSVFITALLYFSAIFYDPTQMTFSIGGFNMQQIIKLNPMYWYITGFRRTLMWGIPLDLNMFAVCGICAVVSMWVGVHMFRKTQDRFVLHI